eukprot:10034615-Alexandrium_andersonii.AAC.1
MATCHEPGPLSTKLPTAAPTSACNSAAAEKSTALSSGAEGGEGVGTQFDTGTPCPRRRLMSS